MFIKLLFLVTTLATFSIAEVTDALPGIPMNQSFIPGDGMNSPLALFGRQTCSPGYGLCPTNVCCTTAGPSCCTTFAGCCDPTLNHACCGTGCMPTGSECCSDGGFCYAGNDCCAGHCIPAGTQCCTTGNYCPAGKHCVLVNSQQRCCDDPDCTDGIYYAPNGGTGVSTKGAATATFQTAATNTFFATATAYRYYTVTITWYYYSTSYTGTHITDVTFVTMTTSTITSFYATGNLDASLSAIDFSATASFPTPANLAATSTPGLGPITVTATPGGASSTATAGAGARPGAAAAVRPDTNLFSFIIGTGACLMVIASVF